MWSQITDEIENHYKKCISTKAYSLSHTISNDWKLDTTSNSGTLIIQPRIPIILSSVLLACVDPNNATIKIWKDDSVDQLIFTKLYDDSDYKKQIDIVLLPGLYAIECCDCTPELNGNLIPSTAKNNKFFILEDGGNSAFNGFGTYTNTVCGFQELTFKYRIIDTYLGLQTSVIPSDQLIPQAWYNYWNGTILTQKLWTGSLYI